MKKKCLVIPGNPAVASQYLSWIDEIKSQNEDLDISYATSYILFDRKLSYVKYHDAMCDHYEKILLKLGEEQKITILAHSAGSYFALRLLEKYPERIDEVILLFPYIGYSKIPLLYFVRIPYYIDRVFPLAEIVAFCKNLLMLLDKNVQYISRLELTANLRFGVRQCVYFIKNKFNAKKIEAYRDKIHFIYIENDKWCPQATIDLLRPVSIYEQTLIPHDFIVSAELRERMTKTILQYLV